MTSLSDKVSRAIGRATSRIIDGHEMTLKTTGQKCVAFPWRGAPPAPWKDGYTRVRIQSDNGAVTQIVRNDKLIHG